VCLSVCVFVCVCVCLCVCICLCFFLSLCMIVLKANSSKRKLLVIKFRGELESLLNHETIRLLGNNRRDCARPPCHSFPAAKFQPGSLCRLNPMSCTTLWSKLIWLLEECWTPRHSCGPSLAICGQQLPCEAQSEASRPDRGSRLAKGGYLVPRL